MKALQLILSNKRYFAPAWVFASLNILAGTWVLYIPYVKNKLAIDDAELGIALFCFALGILVFIPMVPILTQRFGVGRMTFIAVLLMAFSFLFPILMNTYSSLCIALFFTGICSGLTDVSMNALISEIEKKDKVGFMSAAHGFFSLGGVIGAGIGSLLIPFFNLPFWHMCAVAIFVFISNLLVATAYTKVVAEEKKQVIKESILDNIKTYKPLFALAIIAMIIMSSEGSIEHWSKLYLLDVSNVESDQLAGIGFILFSAMMTTGRFFGDGISERYGSYTIIIYGCLLAIIGYLFILMTHWVAAMVGFGFIGLGFSVIIPEVFRLAGKSEQVSSSAGISFVSGIAFAGFLLGPVILGFISKMAGLKMSFVALLVACMIALLFVIKIKKRNQLS